MIKTVTHRLFSTLSRRMTHKNDYTNTLDYNWTEAGIAEGIDAVLHDAKAVKFHKINIIHLFISDLTRSILYRPKNFIYFFCNFKFTLNKF